MASFSAVRAEVLDREERKRHYGAHLMGLNAYDRHKKFMYDYVHYYSKTPAVEYQRLPIKTDQDNLRETYRFIRTEDDDTENSWGQRLAKRYYDKLFKEYCIADMTRYKDGKIGLRWRVEKEVISGKGQFVCGNKKCDAKEDLSSYEVNFSYREAEESKQALVKLRVCPSCANKLNYRREKERERLSQMQEKRARKRSRSEESHGKSVSSKKKRQSADAEVEPFEEQETSLKFGDEELRCQSRRHGGSSHTSADPHVKGAQAIDSQEEYDKYFKGMFL